MNTYSNKHVWHSVHYLQLVTMWVLILAWTTTCIFMMQKGYMQLILTWFHIKHLCLSSAPTVWWLLYCIWCLMELNYCWCHAILRAYSRDSPNTQGVHIFQDLNDSITLWINLSIFFSSRRYRKCCSFVKKILQYNEH